MALRLSAAALAAVSLLVCPVIASEFATTIVQVNLGPNANPSFPPARMLGGPTGGGLNNGSVDVCVLGVGGFVTVGFNVLIQDGPGADLIACENGFQLGGTGVFAEVAALEVSSDGVTFARFPSRYVGPPSVQPPFGTLPIGTFSGLVGGLPVIANVLTNTVPPDDPVRAGGDAFDLAELAQDSLVLGGQVDLAAIQFVRVVDVAEGAVNDSFGNAIYDNGGATGSADIDAIAAVNHSGNASADQPICDLRVDGLGFLELTLGDPNGFFNLDLAELRASFDLVEFPFFSVLPAFQIVSFDGQVAVLRSIAPLAGAGVRGAFAVSVKDQSGRFSGDQWVLQG